MSGQLDYILAEELNVKMSGNVELLVDNKSAIDLAKNPISHGRSKHIETKFHFLRDQVNKDKIDLKLSKEKNKGFSILSKKRGECTLF